MNTNKEQNIMIYTEITPNPASLKFIVGRMLLPKGSADFPDESATEDAPLAAKLFNFKFVEGVFISKNFVTITKKDNFQWEEIIPVVKDYLKAYLASDQPVFTGKYQEQQQEVQQDDDDEVTKKIKSLLESHVRPAIAQDGGDIIYDSFEDGVLRLRLQGSCSGCPSSVVTLKQGIEGLMTHMVPEVKAVEAV